MNPPCHGLGHLFVWASEAARNITSGNASRLSTDRSTAPLRPPPAVDGGDARLFPVCCPAAVGTGGAVKEGRTITGGGRLPARRGSKRITWQSSGTWHSLTTHTRPLSSAVTLRPLQTRRHKWSSAAVGFVGQGPWTRLCTPPANPGEEIEFIVVGAETAGAACCGSREVEAAEVTHLRSIRMGCDHLKPSMHVRSVTWDAPLRHGKEDPGASRP